MECSVLREPPSDGRNWATHHDSNKRIEYQIRKQRFLLGISYKQNPVHHGSSSTGSPSAFHAVNPPTMSVAFKSPISCNAAAAKELASPS